MDKEFVDKMLDYLEKERISLQGSLDDKARDIRDLVKNTEAGDEVDAASDVVDRTLLDSLSAHEANRLSQIEAAITRIRQGNYGICIKCGKEIPQRRLEALPFAITCVSCASKK